MKNKVSAIKMALLKELVAAKQVLDISAEALPSKQGFYLIASTRNGFRQLYTTHKDRPKLYRTLDGFASDVESLGFDTFTVVGLHGRGRSS